MSKTKTYFHEYLSSEEFDLMDDYEFEIWQIRKNEFEYRCQQQLEAEQSAYEEALSAAK